MRSGRADIWNGIKCPCCGESLEIAVSAPSNAYLQAQLTIVPSAAGELEFFNKDACTRLDGKVVLGNT